jgi:glycosyltransferase involved in cell wall biosynthesis
MTAPLPERGRDVVLLLSYESVGDVVRRGFARPPDRLLRTLAEDPAVERLLIVGPYRSRLVRLARTMLRRDEPTLEGMEGVTSIEPVRWRRRDPTSIGAVERTYGHYDRQVARTVESTGLREPDVISFHPLAAGFAPAAWARSVTYYARDDWASLPTYEPWWPACRVAYTRLRELRRKVIAVSQPLLERIAPTGPAIVVPNGVDPAEWSETRPVPDWFGALPSPRMLYVGTLDDRLDLDAIGELAANFPDGSVVLVGPSPDGFPTERLTQPNVHVLHSRPREQILALVQHSDLCLLTHATTPLTQAMSPLKLYEYLGAGRPVLSADLPPVRAIDDHVVTYRTTADIVPSARRALALGPMAASDRAAFVEANRWAVRHQTALDLAFR